MDFFSRLWPAALTATTFHILRFRRLWTAVLVGGVLLSVGGYYALLAAPADFTPGNIVIISRGSSVHDAALTLASARVVQHPKLLELLVRLSGRSNNMQSGAYRFSEPENVVVIAWRLISGGFGIPPVRFTIPEGSTVRDMAKRVHEAFPEITLADFISVGEPYEGYLFPDTYQFQAPPDAASVVIGMRENFDTKTLPLKTKFDASGHSLSDLVIMASLIEREGRTLEDKRMISGILWNRIARGMPLQVDAVFGYIYHRDTYSPSFADLKVDSPYNTYTHKGLPPGPIGSPGLESLEAAATPVQTDFLFYITGNDGLMHYATTFAGHQENLRNYLGR